MKSGSTGWSTGPHLHFEVRVNGVAVDSLPYVTGGNSKNTDNNEVNNTVNNNKNTILNNNTTN